MHSNQKYRIGDEVYYVKPSFGTHKVVKYNAYDREYLLDLDGHLFWAPEERVKPKKRSIR